MIVVINYRCCHSCDFLIFLLYTVSKKRHWCSTL